MDELQLKVEELQREKQVLDGIRQAQSEKVMRLEKELNDLKFQMLRNSKALNKVAWDHSDRTLYAARARDKIEEIDKLWSLSYHDGIYGDDMSLRVDDSDVTLTFKSSEICKRFIVECGIKLNTSELQRRKKTIIAELKEIDEALKAMKEMENG